MGTGKNDIGLIPTGHSENPNAASAAKPSGSGGGGGGGGSTGPTDEQRRAAGNLGGITAYNAATITGKAGQGNRAYDIADKQNAAMRDIQTKQNKQSAGSDWYAQQQKLQSVNSQLADAAGNAMYGSFSYDLADAIARKDDMDDVAVLSQQRQNQNQIDNDYYEAIMATTNSRNELALDTEASLRELASDYAAQLNNIHPDLANGVIDSKGRTINVPEWLKTSYFDDHLRQPVQPETQGLYRPPNAAADAVSKELVDKEQDSFYSDSGNDDYWSRMRRGYRRRTQ